MNVLILSTHFNTGGITSYIVTLAKGLKQLNQGVFVATSGGNMVEALASSGIGHITLNIRTKSELNPKIYLALNQLARFIKEKNIDIIHAHTRVTQVMAFFLSRMTKRPYVSTCHGFFKTRFGRRIFPCWGAGVIAISEAVRRHLLDDWKLSERDVFLIHSGIDLSDFPSLDENLRQKRRQEFKLPSVPTVGIIARLSEVKGHDVLIAAMKRVREKVPQVLLIIVGEGTLEESLKKQADGLGLKDAVRFLPIVNKTPQILPAFDVFVMPSLQEGLGLSVMEAQAMGLPVIASRVGGLVSLVEDGETGILVEPGDSRPLAEAIVNLLNDKAKMERLGKNARKFIAKKFSFEGMIHRAFNLYQQVAREA